MLKFKRGTGRPQGGHQVFYTKGNLKTGKSAIAGKTATFRQRQRSAEPPSPQRRLESYIASRRVRAPSPFAVLSILLTRLSRCFSLRGEASTGKAAPKRRRSSIVPDSGLPIRLSHETAESLGSEFVTGGQSVPEVSRLREASTARYDNAAWAGQRHVPGKGPHMAFHWHLFRTNIASG